MQIYLSLQGGYSLLVAEPLYFESPLMIQAAIVFIVLALIITLITLGVVYYNRVRTYIYNRTVRKSENIILGELNEHVFSYDELDEIPGKELERSMNKLERLKQKSPVFKESLIHVLVLFRHNITGTVTKIISATYDRLRLAEVTMSKLRSKFWFHKTQGLNEVLEMRDGSSLTEVRKLSKDQNIDVRVSAYATLIELESNSKFDFLETEREPLSEWHQIYLLDTVDKAKPYQIPNFTKYLGVKNDSVLLLVLKFIMHFKQFEAIQGLVTLLKHPNERIRNHAICALGSLNADEVESELIDIYPKETNKNKAEILASLGNIASGNSIEFLVAKFLNAEHYTLLKNAVLAITNHAASIRDRALNSLPVLDEEQKAMIRHFQEPLNQYGIN